MDINKVMKNIDSTIRAWQSEGEKYHPISVDDSNINSFIKEVCDCIIQGNTEEDRAKTELISKLSLENEKLKKTIIELVYKLTNVD